MKKLISTTSFIFLLMTILLYFSISETSAQQFQFPHTIKVTITALQAKSSDSCNGKMDFYGRMLINNQPFNFNNIVEGNLIYPHWSGTTTAWQDYNWVAIEIWDEDDAFCGGGDDIVDINPINFVAELRLKVSTVFRKIYIEDHNSQPIQSVYVGMVGQQITLQGYDSYTSGPVAPGVNRGTKVRGHGDRNVETALIQFIVDFYY